VMRGDISAGHLGQTVVYVIITAIAAAVLNGSTAAPRSRRHRTVMELLDSQSPCHSLRIRACCVCHTGRGAGVKFKTSRSYPPIWPAGGFQRAWRQVETTYRHRWLTVRTKACSSCCCAHDPASGRIELDSVTTTCRWKIYAAASDLVPQDAVIFSTTALKKYPLHGKWLRRTGRQGREARPRCA
jgi:ATP-binding cassette subfamily B protein